MSTTDDWRRARLAYLRGLARPSKERRRLLELIEQGELNPKELETLESLWRLERAEAELDDRRAKSRRLLNGERVSARKARNHRLIQLGLLVTAAGMDQDRGLALGAMMDCVARLKKAGGQELANRWKSAGDARLAEEERTTKRFFKAMGLKPPGK